MSETYFAYLLNIFKCINGISNKFIPDLSFDEEISLLGNRMILSGVIYPEGEQYHCGYYTPRVKADHIYDF